MGFERCMGDFAWVFFVVSIVERGSESYRLHALAESKTPTNRLMEIWLQALPVRLQQVTIATRVQQMI